MFIRLENKLDSLARDRFPACLAAVCLFTALVVGYGAALPFFYGIDEPKYAACALEMAATGQWAAPMVDGLPRIEKPPLTYWAMLPFMRAAMAMGGAAWITPFTARLAGIACAALAVAATGLMGRRLAGERAGLAAALVLASSVLFAFKAMIMKVDIVFTCLMAWTSYMLLLRFLGDARMKIAAGAVAFTALGALAKGPFALAPLAGYGLAEIARGLFAGDGGDIARAWRRTVGQTPFFLATGGAAATALLAWLGYAHLASGVDYLSGFMGQFHMNSTASVFTMQDRLLCAGFYLLFVPIIYFFPWGAFVPAALIRPGPKRDDAAGGTLFIACAALVFLGLCVLLYRMRSSRYLLPAIPFAAMTVGRFLTLGPRTGMHRVLVGASMALFAGTLGFFAYRYQIAFPVWDSFPSPRLNHSMWMLAAALAVYAAGFLAAAMIQPSRPMVHVLATALLFALVLPPYFATQPGETPSGKARPRPALSKVLVRKLAETHTPDTFILRSTRFGLINSDFDFFQKDIPKTRGMFYSLNLPFAAPLYLGLLADPASLPSYLKSARPDLAGLPMFEYFTNRTFSKAVVVLGEWEMPLFEAYHRQMPSGAKPALTVAPVYGLTVKWTKAKAYVVTLAR